MILEHSHWSEKLWFFLALSGIFIVILALRDVRKTRRDIIDAGKNGTSLDMIDSQLVTGYIVLGLYVIKTVGAAWANVHEPPPPDYDAIPQTLVTVLTHCAVALGLDIVILYAYIKRRNIRRDLRSRRP